MLASSDPTNFILATVWSLLCFACAVFTWVVYVWWRLRPNDSLSQRIAEWGIRNQTKFLLAIMLGIVIGFCFGLVCGVFAGHWWWAVEVVA